MTHRPHRHSLCALTLCAVAVAWPGRAAAQPGEPWQFQGSLYLYLPSIDGQTSFGPPPGSDTSVGIDGKTILEHLKMTFMGNLEARQGRWGAFTDVVYVNLGASKSGTRDVTVGGLPLPADATADLNYDLKGWAWTLAGSWRVLPDPASPVDLVFGTRLLDIDQKLDWQFSGNVGSIPLPVRTGSQTASLHNWDAIVGLKGRFALGAERKWFVPYYLDVGAGQSKSTWQAIGGVGYTFGWGDLVGAWRHLDYKMKSDSKVQSLSFDGPSVAAVWRW
jgi:hypothetical protein